MARAAVISPGSTSRMAVSAMRAMNGMAATDRGTMAAVVPMEDHERHRARGVDDGAQHVVDGLVLQHVAARGHGQRHAQRNADDHRDGAGHTHHQQGVKQRRNKQIDQLRTHDLFLQR
ncbi:hypothetical protein G6F46_014778 [Rhizopus delemar]|nr:hypothetical protein G6F46_014778 [Rhizopus delemar]